jgi:hypothetical protein
LKISTTCSTWKKYLKHWALLVFFKNLTKVRIRPVGEQSPNLVTLFWVPSGKIVVFAIFAKTKFWHQQSKEGSVL